MAPIDSWHVGLPNSMYRWMRGSTGEALYNGINFSGNHLRGHDRWLGALSRAPRRGVRGGPASHLYVSYRGRGGQSRCRCRGQRTQSPGSPTTQTAPRAPEHASGQAGGPHEKAAGSTTRRVVHPSVSLRPTAPEHHRTQDLVARQPWIAPVTRATGSHGPGVCVIRSALSDPDRSGHTGQTAASAPAVPPVGRHTQETLF